MKISSQYSDISIKETHKQTNNPKAKSVFVWKEKTRRNVLFLGALRWKHVILILMYHFLSGIKNKSRGNTRWKDIFWHLQIILSSYLVVLTFQSASFSASERKKIFFKVPQIKNVRHSSLITLSQLLSQTKSLDWWYSRRPTHRVDGCLKSHLGLIIVTVLVTKVSHTSGHTTCQWIYSGGISSRNANCTQPQRDLVWNTLHSSHQARSET